MRNIDDILEKLREAVASAEPTSVFSNGALLYSYFPGGDFDADGAPHYLHTDYQGSVVMATDSAGTIEAPPSIGQCRTTRDYNLN